MRDHGRFEFGKCCQKVFVDQVRREATGRQHADNVGRRAAEHLLQLRNLGDQHVAGDQVRREATGRQHRGDGGRVNANRRHRRLEGLDRGGEVAVRQEVADEAARRQHLGDLLG